MNTSEILIQYLQKQELSDIKHSVNQNKIIKVQLNGLKGSSKAIVTSAIYSATTHHEVVILSNREEANYFMNDVQSFLDKKKIHFFPSPYKKDHSFEEYDKASILDRTEVLSSITKESSTGHIVITYPEALCEKVITKDLLQKNTFEIKTGDKLDMEFIIDFLVEYGFERTDFVYEAGTFSLRGGIVDIFSYAYERPYRIEFLEDSIESIRTFDPASQLSEKNLQRITIIPNIEDEEEKIQWISFFDFIPENTFVYFSDLDFVQQIIEKFRNEAIEAYEANSELFSMEPTQLFNTSSQFLKGIEKFTCFEFSQKTYFKPDLSLTFNTIPQPPFNKNFALLDKDLRKNQKEGYKNIIFSESPKQIERIYAIFEDIDAEVTFTPVYKSLHEGFIDHDLKIAFYTEHQIFNRYHKYKPSKTYDGKKTLTLKELKELKPGDFITHVDHGVGIYKGLEKIEIAGKRQEAVRLEYKGGDLLYVNIHSLHKISRYTGKEGKAPQLNKLGSNKWENLKKKTKNRVKDIARDLIKLYAERRAQKGFKYSPDSYLQTELEASFLYEDTPDQAKSTEEVKHDMESDFPMDRLVCGDVGFGKTEIAMRAAFKAVTDGKQVAVLVPTTVLTIQHFHTFRERFKDFPVTIDFISRFKTPGQQKKTIQKLIDGKIDIIIGTHRLAGKDIKFKDLGLLIIDEEQKFGVAVKEKIKALKVNVDTLTLTATPIPRTLQFSLMAARDLSVINTPPPNRQPVETRIETFNEDIIREAIDFEISRGGQVFFVHNRIKDIYSIRDIIERLVPYAKVGVGHGQMESKQLEEVMFNFVEGYYDVLLSTSIVESGLDIPNANTIIINNAQNFGLSDLYQLRGRVGRSNKKAFSYLITPPKSVLTQDARRRLSAIEEFSDLGSGFNIAMRDLDIRGAGNLLGAEQSGFIAEVGFEMFHKILDEAIVELKDTEFKDLFKEEGPKSFSSRDCQIDTDLEILIPDHYVTSIDERLNLYHEINNLKNESDLLSFKYQLIDRFGPVPRQVEELFDAVKLKWLAMELGMEKIILKRKLLKATFKAGDENSEFYQSDLFGGILTYIQTHPSKCRFEQITDGLRIVIKSIPDIEKALHVITEIYAFAKMEEKVT